ncbi:50S ribosomal protein L35 [Candidatus Saccharibacteria bacterium]|nr:50S ribosomal protein L35 [Candidatus Saccharibacteria bacterium]
MAKEKMKVSKTVKDRFKVTGRKKLLHARGGVKHRRSKEQASLKTRGRRLKRVSKPESKRIKKLLGIGK